MQLDRLISVLRARLENARADYDDSTVISKNISNVLSEQDNSKFLMEVVICHLMLAIDDKNHSLDVVLNQPSTEKKPLLDEVINNLPTCIKSDCNLRIKFLNTYFSFFKINTKCDSSQNKVNYVSHAHIVQNERKISVYAQFIKNNLQDFTDVLGQLCPDFYILKGLFKENKGDYPIFNELSQLCEAIAEKSPNKKMDVSLILNSDDGFDKKGLELLKTINSENVDDYPDRAQQILTAIGDSRLSEHDKIEMTLSVLLCTNKTMLTKVSIFPVFDDIEYLRDLIRDHLQLLHTYPFIFELKNKNDECLFELYESRKRIQTIPNTREMGKLIEVFELKCLEKLTGVFESKCLRLRSSGGFEINNAEIGCPYKFLNKMRRFFPGYLWKSPPSFLVSQKDIIANELKKAFWCEWNKNNVDNKIMALLLLEEAIRPDPENPTAVAAGEPSNVIATIIFSSRGVGYRQTAENIFNLFKEHLHILHRAHTDELSAWIKSHPNTLRGQLIRAAVVALESGQYDAFDGGFPAASGVIHKLTLLFEARKTKEATPAELKWNLQDQHIKNSDL